VDVTPSIGEVEELREECPLLDVNTVTVIMREMGEVGGERGEGVGGLEAVGICSVGAVDLCVDGVVGVSGGEDAIVGVGEDGGEGSEAGALGLVEHLALQLGKLVLQLGKGVGKGLDDAGVDGVENSLLGSTQVLGSLQG